MDKTYDGWRVITMPKVSWDELNDVIHSIKQTLTKIVGIELMCKKIKVDAIQKMEGIEKYCSVVKREAIDELEKINKIILSQIKENGDESSREL